MTDPDNSILEDARKRARRRLVGAVVLALAAAVVLPMFLESDPRPLGPDVQIQIPAIDDAKFQNRLSPAGSSKAPAAERTAPPPLPGPAGTQSTTSPEAGAATVAAAIPTVTDRAANKSDPQVTAANSAAASNPGGATASAASVAATPALGAPTPAKPAAASAKPMATVPPKKSAAPQATQGPSMAPQPASSLPAFSLTATVPAPGAAAAPNAKSAPTAAPPVTPGQFVVQVGAFVDAGVARELAAKAGAQGFRVFLEPVTTKSGPVQRVRVGPFGSRAEADAAAAKLKAAGFTAVTRPR